MSDLHARERHDPDTDTLVVDLIEEDRVVGFAYDDDGGVLVEFFPDEDGHPWAFEAADLLRVLEVAARMLGAADDAEPVLVGEAGQHPVDALAMQFDAQAVQRGPEDEGFYPLRVAAGILAAADGLGLAVVYLEGLTPEGDGAVPLPGHKAELGDTNEGGPWALFRAECNTQAAALLERWAGRPGIVVAIEVQDADGERFVL